MSIAFQDARYGLRMVAKNPGFAAAAVITLALGIGAATTIFSVIDNVLLEPFPYVDAQRIVMITIHNDDDNRPGGRSFFRDDDKPGAPPVFLMAYKLWAGRFSLDPKIVGSTFTLNGVPTTLVGVMPPRVTKLGADLWIPVVLDRGRPVSQARYFMFQAHLKPGVTLRQAQADVNVIAHRFAQQRPKDYPKQFSIQVDTWIDRLVGQFSKTLYTLAAAVG